MVAVTTSMPMMACMGMKLSSSAPSGGEMILITPCSVWFSPATRDSCSLGTMSEVEACMAGQWKVPAMDRSSIMT